MVVIFALVILACVAVFKNSEQHKVRNVLMFAAVLWVLALMLHGCSGF